MTKINLLDWRTALREKRRQKFLVMLGLGVAAAIAIVVAGYLLVLNEISYQQGRNDYLRGQISEIDQKIKEIEELEKVKANLLARMKVIEELQGSRSATVHFFDEIVNTVPDGIRLTLIKQEGDSVKLEGIAESNGRISTYMKNLEASQWFEKPQLIVISTTAIDQQAKGRGTQDKDKQNERTFTLTVRNLTKPAEAPVAPPAPATTGTAGSNALTALGAGPLPPAPAGTTPASAAPTSATPAPASSKPIGGAIDAAAQAAANKATQTYSKATESAKAKTDAAAQKIDQAGDGK